MKKLLTLAVILTSINAYAYDKWQCIDGCNSMLSTKTYRMSTPTGWIVVVDGGRSETITFVPDAKHEWKP